MTTEIPKADTITKVKLSEPDKFRLIDLLALKQKQQDFYFGLVNQTIEPTRNNLQDYGKIQEEYGHALAALDRDKSSDQQGIMEELYLMYAWRDLAIHIKPTADGHICAGNVLEYAMAKGYTEGEIPDIAYRSFQGDADHSKSMATQLRDGTLTTGNSTPEYWENRSQGAQKVVDAIKTLGKNN